MDNKMLQAGIEQAREASGEMAAAARAMARSRRRQARYAALAALAGFFTFIGFWIGIAVGKWHLFGVAVLLMSVFLTVARRFGKRHAEDVVQLGAALHEASARAQALINEAAVAAAEPPVPAATLAPPWAAASDRSPDSAPAAQGENHQGK